MRQGFDPCVMVRFQQSGAVMSSTLVILGSGTSFGVPVIGCDCAVCRSEDPRDRRTRASGWVRGHGSSLLLDMGPDLREQCLREGIATLDGVLLTHTHADHLHGIDDLRAFSQRRHQALPVYASPEHLAFVRSHFEYIFADDMKTLGWGIPRLELREVGTEAFDAGGFHVQPVPLRHGRWACTGYRLDNLAYLTDCSQIPDGSWRFLKDLDVLVIDALRWSTHKTHESIGESLEVIRRLRPRRAILTHLCHEVSHAADSLKLPPGVELAYDGMAVTYD